MKINYTAKRAETPYLKFFEREYEHNGKTRQWAFCSREDVPVAHADKKPNAVVIIAEKMHKPKGATKNENCLVVTSEYRVPIMAREWGFPAGLINNGEDPKQAAIREFKEETGMEFVPTETSAPNLYNSAGMSNESVTLVFGTAYGEPSKDHLEDTEDIDVFIWTYEDLEKFMEECNQGKHAVSDKAWLLFWHFWGIGKI